MTVIDLNERRQLRDLARGVDELESRINAALLECRPRLAEQVLSIRQAELRLRWRGILTAAREGALESIATAVAAQVAAGEEPDLLRAVCLAFAATKADLIGRAEAAAAALPAELARMRAEYGPALLTPQETPP